MVRTGVARRLSRSIGAGGLLAVAGIHAGWGLGSPWTASDERSLARAVIGDDRMPPAEACFAVAALLASASALVAGYPRSLPRLRRVGVSGVAATLAARGLIGAFGLMPRQQRDYDTFAWWDRRLYSPLCLTLALLCAFGLDEDAQRIEALKP